MMRPLRDAAFAGLLLVLLPMLPSPGLGQVPGQEGWISILEPEQWRGEGTRGIIVQERRSVRVMGLAFHPTGVTRVLINGVQASLEPQGNGQVRFFGYVPVTTQTREVEVVAYSQGPPLIETYSLTPVPAEKTYQDPQTAWSEAGTGFRGKRFAVIVGVSAYMDPDITPLRYADADAQAFYDFLTSEQAGLGGFEAENVQLLLNEDATYRNIRTALYVFLRQATERDVVLLYFAGHGAPDPFRPQDYYLLTHDTEAANLAGTGLPMEAVSDAVSRLRSRDVVVITDACHSAAVGGQVAMRSEPFNAINQVFLNRLTASSGGFVTMTASEVNQYSQEDARWGGGHGVFTYYLLQGLEGQADEDQDYIVTLGELFEFVRDRVQRETLNAQVPTVSQTPWDRAWPMAVVAPPQEPVVAEEPEAQEVEAETVEPVAPPVESPPVEESTEEPPAEEGRDQEPPAEEEAQAEPPPVQPDSARAEPPATDPETDPPQTEGQPETAGEPGGAEEAQGDSGEEAGGPGVEPEAPAEEPDRPGEEAEEEPQIAPPERIPVTPQQALIRGLLVPGLGEFQVGQSGRGAAVLVGAVGALAIGVLSERTVEDCQVQPTGGSCPPSQLVGSSSERHLLVPGMAVALGLTVLGAVDAYKAAQADQAAGGGQMGLRRGSGPTLLAPAPVVTPRTLGVQLLRLSF